MHSLIYYICNVGKTYCVEKWHAKKTHSHDKHVPKNRRMKLTILKTLIKEYGNNHHISVNMLINF